MNKMVEKEKVRKVLMHYRSQYNHNIDDYILELLKALESNKFASDEEINTMVSLHLSQAFNKETDPAKRHFLKLLVEDINKA